MITFSPKDTSILGRVLQYHRIPMEERMHWLSGASEPAQKVAKYILGTLGEEPSEEIRAAAEVIQRWLDINRRIGELRPAKGGVQRMRL